MITINKRITHANELQRQLRNVTKATQSSGREAQEPSRLHCWDGPTAARAGRPVRRGAGLQHQLAAGAKLRHPHTAAAGPDGSCAAGAGRAGARVSQEEVQGSGLINRGLRAPAIWNQGSSCKQQATSVKRQATSFR